MMHPVNNERGVALLMAVFIIALATILVMNLAYTARFDQRASRSFSEGIQADYVMKSAIVLGQVLIELPKLDDIKEDWLGEPWALIGANQALPIPNFYGEPRMTIVDEDGKIDLNWILNQSSGDSQQETTDGSLYWKNTVRDLFELAGFSRQQFSDKEFRTLGNTAFAPNDQVAVLHDWLDNDQSSFTSAAFDGRGAESALEKDWFYNRKLEAISELLLVPGFTLERLVHVAPYVRVSPQSNTGQTINVNTAPRAVLVAMGFPESQVDELLAERVNLPITREILGTLIEGDQQLSQHTKVTSNEFSIYVRVKMSSVTRWARAIITVSGSGIRRKSKIQTLEFY